MKYQKENCENIKKILQFSIVFINKFDAIFKSSKFFKYFQIQKTSLNDNVKVESIWIVSGADLK
jgi:reverse gyrase